MINKGALRIISILNPHKNLIVREKCGKYESHLNKILIKAKNIYYKNQFDKNKLIQP